MNGLKTNTKQIKYFIVASGNFELLHKGQVRSYTQPFTGEWQAMEICCRISRGDNGNSPELGNEPRVPADIIWVDV